MSTSIYDDQDTDDHIVGDSIMPDGSHDDLGSTEDERLNEINALEAAYRGKDDDGRGKNSDKSLDENSLREAEEEGLDTTAAESSGEKKQLAEKVGSEVGDNGKDYFNSGVKKKAAKGMLTKKKSLLWIGSGGLLLSVALGFLMFMTIYRSEHLRNLLWDYRFARFHRQVGKRIKANLLTVEGITADSPEKVAKFEKTSLFNKIKGYTPEKAFAALGKEGLTVGIEKQGIPGFRKQTISSFVDPTDGKTYVREGASNRPAGSLEIPRAEFETRLTSQATTLLDNTNHSKFFQRQTRKLLRDKVNIRFGDRYKSYRERLKTALKGEDRQPTEEEKRKALREADLENARGNKSPPTANGALEDASKAAQQDLLDGTPEPAKADLTPPPPGTPAKTPSKTVQALNGASSTYAEYSSFVFMATMGCILRDLSGSLNEAMVTRIEAPMRAASDLFGEAEQLKSNDNIELDAVGQRNDLLSNVEQSAALQRINGTPEADISDNAKLDDMDLPFEFFGIDISTLATYNNAVDDFLNPPLVGFVVDEVCGLALNPTAQAVLAGADVVALIFSLGATASAKGITEAVKQGLIQSARIAGTVGVFKIVFEYAVPKLLFAMAGSGGILSAGDANNGNKIDLGATLLANEYGKDAGAPVISTLQAQQDQAETMAAIKKQKVDDQGLWAYVDPSSPYSLTGQLAMSLPGSASLIPGAVLSKSIGSVLKAQPLSLLSSVFSPKAEALGNGYTENYGVAVRGIPDYLIDTSMIDNALIVEGEDGSNLTSAIEKYGFCYTDTTSQIELSALGGKDYSICSDEMAQRLGLYNIDSCTGVYMGGDTTANNCSVFSGAGDVTEGSESSTATTTASSGMVGALPEWESTTACPSDPDITDGGMGSAKRDGRDVPFKLCNVMGFGRFNTVYASNFLGVFKSAKEAGFDLRSGGGSYRSYKAAADEWKNRCGDRDYSLGFDSPPCTGSKMAPPGKSNHELGLAADLTCPGAGAQLGGGTETRSTFRRDDPCVKWVLENSPQFGLVLQCDGKKADGSFLFGEDCESWHLSPTGG